MSGVRTITDLVADSHDRASRKGWWDDCIHTNDDGCHLISGVCRDEAACDARQARPDPVAAVRLEDGSQVVAYEPAGLEVRAFGVDDLDARGLPRWKP